MNDSLRRMGVPEGDPAVELFLGDPVAALDLADTLRRAAGGGPVGDPEVMQMAGEVLVNLGVLVVLGPVEGHGETPADFVRAIADPTELGS